MRRSRCRVRAIEWDYEREHDPRARHRSSVQDSFELPSAPDQFQRLWTPHRTAYVSGGQKDYTEKTCPFCTAPSRSDEESLIVHRGEHAGVCVEEVLEIVVRGVLTAENTGFFSHDCLNEGVTHTGFTARPPSFSTSSGTALDVMRL